jgi:L-histidine Nalpha-methyltransferase
MRDGIESFPARWNELALKNVAQHYVSLGIGTGEKDFTIVSHMMRWIPSLYFFPVDMSADLMRRGVLHVVRNSAALGHPLSREHVLPIQIDFSVPQNLTHT